MNERLKQLAEKATQHSPEGFYTYTQIDAEKFAELIVRECAEYAEHELDMAGYKKKFMLKHFGVEE